MAEKYTPVKGDRVRVVLEVEVADPGSVTGKCLCTRKGLLDLGYLDGQHVVSVEKIEPPVKVFQPGDVVRDVSDYIPGQVLALTNEGYVNITLGGMVRKYGENRDRERITSERYERVTLS